MTRPIRGDGLSIQNVNSWRSASRVGVNGTLPLPPKEERVGAVQCPRCGLLYSAFRETGRLGCADCYSAFQFQLRPLLRRIHGDTRHRGKVPAHDGEGASRSRQVQRLYDELQRAVDREEFERAAEVRDEIKRLEGEHRAAAQTKSSVRREGA